MLLLDRMDEHREIYPVARPDAADLDRFMFETDSPYEHRVTADGGLEIRAAGRSAITLLVWLEGIVSASACHAERRCRPSRGC
jgi:hypothetical protein